MKAQSGVHAMLMLPFDSLAGDVLVECNMRWQSCKYISSHAFDVR